jgi:hypothetical protein
MRVGVGLWLGLVAVAAVWADEPDKAQGTRYGIAADTKTYPQATAREALGSVLKAALAKRFDYLVAQLADPAFVDDRVRRLYGGRFEDQVEDTRARLDPSTVKLLGRFLKDGQWQEEVGRVTVRLKDAGDRRLYFKKDGGRWFMEHPSRAKE